MRVEGFHNSPAQYLLRLLRSAFLRLALPYPELLKMVRHFDSETMYPMCWSWVIRFWRGFLDLTGIKDRWAGFLVKKCEVATATSVFLIRHIT